MDLGTIRKRLRQQPPCYYRGEGGHERFAMDMRLVWHNCKVFNERGSEIWEAADRMARRFELLFALWVVRTEERERDGQYREDFGEVEAEGGTVAVGVVGKDERDAAGKQADEGDDEGGGTENDEQAKMTNRDADQADETEDSLQLRPCPQPRPPPQWRWPLVGQWIRVSSLSPPMSQALSEQPGRKSAKKGAGGSGAASTLSFVDAIDTSGDLSIGASGDTRANAGEPPAGANTEATVGSGAAEDASVKKPKARADVWVEVVTVDVEGRRVLVLHDNLAHEWVGVGDDMALEAAMYERQEQQEQEKLQQWELERAEAKELHVEQERARLTKQERQAAQAGKARARGKGGKAKQGTKEAAKQSAKEAKRAKTKRASRAAVSPAVDSEPVETWSLGARVEANYFESGRFYPGKIASATRGSDGKWVYCVDYDDGDKETDVRPEMLKACAADEAEKAEKARMREKRVKQRKKAPDDGVGDTEETPPSGRRSRSRGKTKCNGADGNATKRQRR
jgi:hypothetical protein